MRVEQPAVLGRRAAAALEFRELGTQPGRGSDRIDGFDVHGDVDPARVGEQRVEPAGVHLTGEPDDHQGRDVLAPTDPAADLQMTSADAEGVRHEHGRRHARRSRSAPTGTSAAAHRRPPRRPAPRPSSRRPSSGAARRAGPPRSSGPATVPEVVVPVLVVARGRGVVGVVVPAIVIPAVVDPAVVLPVVAGFFELVGVVALPVGRAGCGIDDLAGPGAPRGRREERVGVARGGEHGGNAGGVERGDGDPGRGEQLHRLAQASDEPGLGGPARAASGRARVGRAVAAPQRCQARAGRRQG